MIGVAMEVGDQMGEQMQTAQTGGGCVPCHTNSTVGVTLVSSSTQNSTDGSVSYAFSVWEEAWTAGEKAAG